MVDTHAHLGLCEDAPAALVERAAAAGVARILTVGLDERSNQAAVAHARDHEGVFASVGRHPNSAAGFDDEAAAAIDALAREPEVVAIGETGLDYYHEHAPRADQRRAFRAQVQIARRAGLPLVIHMRSREPEGEDGDAVADAFAVLAAEADGVDVVLHCFSAAPQRVAEAAARGWRCSFAGNVTYPRAEDLREAAARVPDDLILVETDSPFLAPQSRRGKPNEPARVVETAGVVAEARGIGLGELEALVDANAAAVFGW